MSPIANPPRPRAPRGAPRSRRRAPPRRRSRPPRPPCATRAPRAGPRRPRSAPAPTAPQGLWRARAARQRRWPRPSRRCTLLRGCSPRGPRDQRGSCRRRAPRQHRRRERAWRHHLSCIRRRQAEAKPGVPDLVEGSMMRSGDQLGGRSDGEERQGEPRERRHRRVLEEAVRRPCLRQGSAFAGGEARRPRGRSPEAHPASVPRPARAPRRRPARDEVGPAGRRAQRGLRLVAAVPEAVLGGTGVDLGTAPIRRRDSRPR